MSDFTKAIKVVLAHEGGISDHPADHGGYTRYGVTWPFFREAFPDGTKDDFFRLDQAAAEGAYKRVLWDRWRLWQVNDQTIATKLMDMMVNLGARTATRMCQQALSLIGHPTTPDGFLGHYTMQAINAALPRLLLHELKRQQREYYERIVALHPDQQAFLKGWLRRAAWPEEV